MKPTDPNAVEDTDSPEREALNAYPAGKNHDDLLLCGADNDTEWIMSNVHVDLQEMI